MANAIYIPIIKGDKGEKGDTPVNGVDYFTETEKQTFKEDVRDELEEEFQEEINENIELSKDIQARQTRLEQKYDEQIKELANENPQLPEIVDARQGFDTLGGVIKQKIFHFDTVTQMKNCLTLVPGDVVEVLGYYEVNDGGGATYQIVNDNSLVDDGGSVHDLTNGLKAKLIIKDRINVKQFGAKGDGVADDTTAIETAFNLQKNLTVNYNQYVGTYENHIFPKIFNVYFPRGQYIYNGDGIEINDYGHLICIGESKMSVSIYIVKDIVLFYSNNHVDYLELRNIGFSGGNGVFNQRYNTNTEETPPSNITDKFVIDNCSFRGYKKCCIGSNFFDSPFWYINNNYFIGTTTSIAIAMPGDSAGSIISNNSFELDKYHLKLQDGGRGIVISNNDFIRVADTNEALHDIWILPAYPDGNQSLNYSQGNKCIITKNKFGGEKTKIR